MSEPAARRRAGLAQAAAVALMLLVVAGRPAFAQQGRAVGAGVVHGVVTSLADSAGIFAAEVRSTRGQLLGRADERGRFAVRANEGDTLVVRALGFRERRVVVTSPSPTIALAPSPTVLATHTTTVGQRVIRTTEATTNVTVLERADIDGAAAIAANQLLRQMPGLQEIPSPPSQTSIAIRGLDASRVLVLVDGEPASGSLVENRDIGRLSTVAAERIEVTKGPSSVEFGSDALGGVINLVTAAPSERFSADALVRQGELGRRESTLGASQTIGAFGYRVNGGWRQSDRVTGFDAAGNTLERVYDLRTTARYRVADWLSLRADVQGSRERQRWPVGGGYNGFIDNQSGQGFVEAQVRAAGGSLRARAFVQRYHYQYRQSQKPVPIAGSGDSLEQRERLERYLLAYSRSAGAQTFDLGAQVSARYLLSPGKVDGDSAEDTVSELFLRDSYTRGPVLATAGVRYTSSSLWGDAVNPSFGAAWQVAAPLRLRANVARGFRAPSFKEIRYTFANPAAGYTIVGNTDLHPESSWSTSAGGTWAPRSSLALDVELYRNNVSSLIDTRYEGVNAAGLLVYRNVNVARAHTQGVETSLRLLRGPLDASVGYEYLRARDDETALPLSRRAAHTARMHVAREWSLLSGITTDVTARYTGAAVLVGTVDDQAAVVGRQGAFLSLDGQLRLQLNRMAELSGGVNNLLDQHPLSYTPAYDRQFFLAFRIRWANDD